LSGGLINFVSVQQHRRQLLESAEVADLIVADAGLKSSDCPAAFGLLSPTILQPSAAKPYTSTL
jgi:hypothetical protein